MSETQTPATTAATSPNTDPTEGTIVTVVTGATGFLGRHLVAALAGSLDGLVPADTTGQREVHVISSHADPTFEGVDENAITSHRVDLTDAAAVTDFMNERKPDELFHLAWFNGESASRYSDPANHDWVVIAEHLMESFAKAGGRRAVVAGSCIEYGPEGGVLSENGPADPDSVYGRCKLDAGQRALAVADDFPTLTVAVARIFFVLGRFEEPNRLVPHIIRQLLNGDPAELSSGTQKRDYMHAWDVARGLIAVADSSIEGLVNLGMGEGVAVKDLSQMIGDAVGRPDLLWFGARPGGADTAEEITADITRITTETNWAPSLDLAAASADVVKWWTKQLGH
ncbi:MAG: NAD-dependent epimerase/dehydratase family protein [Acidimicrobiales bacterium]